MFRPDAAAIIEHASATGLTLGSAESVTGGAVSAAMTGVPGASAVWRGAVVAYAIGVKESLLGVPGSAIDAAGVVSADVALAMAHGARARLGVDVAVATTGVAGPDAHGGDPAGRVVIAVVGPGTAVATEFDFAGTRDEVVTEAVDAALAMLRAAVSAGSHGPPEAGEQP